MDEKSNRYALAALKTRRAETAGEIKRLKEMAAYREEQLEHLDASIRILDPDYPLDSIPPKTPRRAKLFKQGELGRSILAALRKSDGGPRHISEIVTAIIEANDYGEAARPGLTPRIRGNLGYLRRRGLVEKRGSGLAARWSLNP